MLQVPSASSEVRGPQGSVLLVDDEPVILKLLDLIVSDLGLTPIQAPDAFAAERLFLGDPGIRALVTDISMPGRSGIDLASAVLATRPDLPILFISGFPGGDLRLGEIERQPNVRYMQKPFCIDDFKSVLDGMLAPEGARHLHPA